MTETEQEPRSRSSLHLSQLGDTVVISWAKPQLPATLTEAQRELAEGLMSGLSNAELAKRRNTTSKTIANQLYAMYRKLGVCSRDELVGLLSKRGPLLDPWPHLGRP